VKYFQSLALGRNWAIDGSLMGSFCFFKPIKREWKTSPDRNAFAVRRWFFCIWSVNNERWQRIDLGIFSHEKWSLKRTMVFLELSERGYK